MHRLHPACFTLGLEPSHPPTFKQALCSVSYRELSHQRMLLSTVSRVTGIAASASCDSCFGRHGGPEQGCHRPCSAECLRVGDLGCCQAVHLSCWGVLECTITHKRR